MTETVAPPKPLVVEEGKPQKGWIGQNVPRKEDKRLVQGEGVFFDDIRRHEMGYVHFVRSPYAHARIKSVDVSKALELKEVYGTLTGDEVAILTDPFFELSIPPGAHMKDYALAVGRVRFVGEPVAAVVASTRELARDAAELIEVDYEPLTPLVDARKAQDDDAPILHEEAGSNVVWEGVFDWGDFDAAVAEADHVVKIKELHFDRFSSTPLECSGCLVEYNRGTGQWTMYCNHQMPGVGAIWMAPALRVGIDKLRFVTQDIGGAFGNKICLHPYFVACCLLARKLNRAVQWTEWRTDQHTANAHGNERWFQEIEVPVKSDGTMLGFKVKAVDDCGAFPRYEPLGCIIWAQVTPGCYRWRNIRVDFTQVTTNKSPVSPNRGYSRMQHLWFTERVVDIVASELGLDPVEVRKRNYVKHEEFPYETPNGCVYDSGDYARCLDIALELVGYDSIDERRAEAESRGKLLGVGIGSTLDSGTNNFGQSTLLNPDLQFSGNNEVATVKLDIFGEIVVTLGTVPQGQGHETTAAQVVSDILGCTPDDVNVRPGHDTYWNSHAGLSGTYASQFAVTGLGAVKGAADMLAGEMKKLASVVLGCTPDDVELAEGQARLKANPEVALPFMALGAILNANNAGLPEDLEITLNCRYMYRPYFELPDKERKFGNLTLTYATQIHACVVEIDPETGVYEIVDYAAVDDCGVRIHPQIVEGQVHGATAHGIGAALMETCAYDESGNLLTGTFSDYTPITAMNMPTIKYGFMETPSPHSYS
ncbi:MAG TPA: xanthine dehydrogenase family protein molybdopterin-binding subunit, partial [Gaiellaceae bacterium]|nr:xanthine dehydrogenase family protein molybdopterin-binding subunit [Gaiellaceae bacterium]